MRLETPETGSTFYFEIDDLKSLLLKASLHFSEKGSRKYTLDIHQQRGKRANVSYFEEVWISLTDIPEGNILKIVIIQKHLSILIFKAPACCC